MIGWSAPLSAGTHLAPEDGACLMEAVSAITGDRWTDAPVSTHPLLAHLARLVNDTVGDEQRDDLIAFIPELIDTNSSDPAVSARIAFVCTNHALESRDNFRLRVLRRLVQRRLHGSSVGVLGWWLFEHGTARLAIQASVAESARSSDHEVVGLLAAATQAMRAERDVTA